jgi:hypothetical protein
MAAIDRPYRFFSTAETRAAVVSGALTVRWTFADATSAVTIPGAYPREYSRDCTLGEYSQVGTPVSTPVGTPVSVYVRALAAL